MKKGNKSGITAFRWIFLGMLLLGIPCPSRILAQTGPVGALNSNKGQQIKVCPLPQKPVIKVQDSSDLSGQLRERFMKNNIEYDVVSFGQLRFDYLPPVDVEHPDGNITKAAAQRTPIPPVIQSLNGKKVAVRGFVVPLETNGGNVKTFLFADQLVTCLYCQGLGYDELIMVTAIDPKGFHINDDQYEEVVTLYGTFEVGEEYQEGQFTSLYRMKADGIERTKKFGIF